MLGQGFIRLCCTHYAVFCLVVPNLQVQIRCQALIYACHSRATYDAHHRLLEVHSFAFSD